MLFSSSLFLMFNLLQVLVFSLLRTSSNFFQHTLFTNLVFFLIVMLFMIAIVLILLLIMMFFLTLKFFFLVLFGNGNCCHGVGHIKFVIITMVNIVVFYSVSCYWSSSWSWCCLWSPWHWSSSSLWCYHDHPSLDPLLHHDDVHDCLILGLIPGQDDLCDYLGQGPLLPHDVVHDHSSLILPFYIVPNHPGPNPFLHDDDDDDVCDSPSHGPLFHRDVVHDCSCLGHLLLHDVVLWSPWS